MPRTQDYIDSVISIAYEGDYARLKSALSELPNHISGVEYEDEVLPKLLLTASLSKHWDCVELLLKQPVDIEAKDSLKALACMMKFKQDDCIEAYIQNAQTRSNLWGKTSDVPQTLLVAAATSGNVDYIKKALQGGADVHFTYSGNSTEETALTKALLFKNFEACQFLLEKGAVIDVSSGNMDAALAEYNTLNLHPKAAQFLELLLEYGGEIDSQLRYMIEDINAYEDTNDAELQTSSEILDLDYKWRIRKTNKIDITDAQKSDIEFLKKKDPYGNRPIDYLGAQGKLSEIFTIELYEKDRKEFKALYNLVPPVYRAELNLESFKSKMTLKTLSDLPNTSQKPPLKRRVKPSRQP